MLQIRVKIAEKSWPFTCWLIEVGRGSSEINIHVPPFRKVTLFQYKIAWRGIPESHEDDDYMCLNDFL